MQGCVRLSALTEGPATEATNGSQQLSKASLLPTTVQVALNMQPLRIKIARGLVQPYGTVATDSRLSTGCAGRTYVCSKPVL